tara:strand:- start:166 stop:270 length:105 start_codon:yes stop_codon:yes gene_type:complete
VEELTKNPVGKLLKVKDLPFVLTMFSKKYRPALF